MENSDSENIQNGSAPNSEEELPQTGIRAAALHLLNNKKEGFMWVSRMATMIFTFFYIFAFITHNPYPYYYKALMTNSITSIIRLNQRMPRFEFSRTYLALLLLEDSCHYILFTLIFLYTYPVTVVLMPVFLFAFLHSTNFSVKLLQICGWNNGRFATMLSSVVQQHSMSILRLVAYTEIFLMPLNIFMLFVGKGNLLTPIIYYRFLTLRYQSKRNPYTRAVFYELRVFVEVLANQPSVPQRIKQLCHKLIQLVSRMAPATAAS